MLSKLKLRKLVQKARSGFYVCLLLTFGVLGVEFSYAHDKQAL